ncbi:hypothetical protein MOV66_10445 [Agrobacterium sp. SHOUNA12C]|nr:hypothetical protein [Rhizobium rhizogenes]MCJ9720834.1 hypothetical protein [Agrobacterium sp. BETTINA12B]MCJ9757063.1 hypothetical protein [Agrobacterium sp. SHOUNA12C]NTF56105.1 hypothetical protein [Rhizobium rhizogenes]NTF75685.1 hypothetical protein [Rhizobium rhizogenes]NTF94713.1 hypothetical protein [Rhizobium rhizogenes]
MPDEQKAVIERGCADHGLFSRVRWCVFIGGFLPEMRSAIEAIAGRIN